VPTGEDSLMNIVSVDAVVKIYGDGAEAVRALDGVSLEVRRGEMLGIVGASGCGKSTLLNLVGCVDLPTTGTVCIDGRSTTGLHDDALTLLRRDQIGTIFQFFNLLPALSVADNVALPLVLARAARAEIERRVEDALAAVGLAEKRLAFPAQLSGGQMQRVAIARAMIHEPAIVLADEPTGNLDSHTGDEILRLLDELQQEYSSTLLMVTHNAQAAGYCNRIVSLRDGHIVADVPCGSEAAKVP
jgi:putative ABC transport system ATP-binding protein